MNKVTKTIKTVTITEVDNIELATEQLKTKERGTTEHIITKYSTEDGMGYVMSVNLTDAELEILYDLIASYLESIS